MLGYDPDTHHEPTTSDYSVADNGTYRPGDRVCMVGTDLYGTVRQGTLYVGQDRPLVDWDDYTRENGDRSWPSTEHLVLVAVPR